MYIRIISIIALCSYCITAYALDLADDSESSFDNYLPQNTTSTPLNHGTLSGDITLTTNYVWNGISQTNNQPAGQADAAYTYEGFYAELWESNTRLYNRNGILAKFELDTLLGYKKVFNNGLGYELTFDRYNYPNVPQFSYNDYYATAIVKFLHFTMAYSNDEFASGKSGIRYSTGIDYVLPEKYVFNLQDFSFIGELGYFELPRIAGNSYAYFSAGLAKQFFQNYTVKLEWLGTNGQAHSAPLDRDHLVATITLSF